MIENWKYKGQEINSIEDMKKHEPRAFGFVYFLNLYDKKTGVLKYQYIGKKNLFSVRTKYLTQKEIESSRKSELRRKKVKGVFKYYKIIRTESDWKNYTSSNLFIKKNLGKFRIEREIILFGIDDSDLTFKEAKEIMCNGCLDDPSFLNEGLSIRRFSNKIIK